MEHNISTDIFGFYIHHAHVFWLVSTSVSRQSLSKSLECILIRAGWECGQRNKRLHFYQNFLSALVL